MNEMRRKRKERDARRESERKREQRKCVKIAILGGPNRF